jgi:exopolysaccharide biosynthesis polyprenyl glycosylphosphotransferase
MNRRTWRWFQIATVVLDALLVVIAFLIAYWMRYDLQLFREVLSYHYVDLWVYLPDTLILTAILLLAFALEGVYRYRRGQSWLDTMTIIFRGTVTGIAIMIIISLLARPLLRSRLIYAYHAVTIVVLLGLSRAIIRLVMGHLRKRGIGVDRVLIVGAGETGRAVMRAIMARPDLGYQVVGFVDDAPDKANSDLGRIRALGDTSQIMTINEREAIDEVIIALPWMSHRKMMSITDQCRRQNVVARIVPDVFQLNLSEVDIDDLDGVPLIGLKGTSIQGWNRTVKRAFDLVGATLIFLVSSPLMLLLALAIKLDSKGPVIFRQARVGRDGRPFIVFKYRTMNENAEAQKADLMSLNECDGPVFKIREDPRRTRMGAWLRRTSMDELPQLFNVFRGEMSLIGPRPATPDEVQQYTPWHMRRLQIAPGMTGLWQVSGRSELPFEEGVLLDLYYVENWSLILDIKILLRTIPAALLARGAF